MVGAEGARASWILTFRQKSSLGNLIDLCREPARSQWGAVLGIHFEMYSLQSDYVLDGFIPELKDNIKAGNSIRPGRGFHEHLQRDFNTVQYGS